MSTIRNMSTTLTNITEMGSVLNEIILRNGQLILINNFEFVLASPYGQRNQRK